MVDRIARVLLVLGVAMLAMGYGFVARSKKLFPTRRRSRPRTRSTP